MSTENSDTRKLIWTAALNNDWETVKQYLEREPSLIDVTGDIFMEGLTDDEGKEYDGYITNMFLIHLAAGGCSDVAVLEYLVSRGADVCAKDDIDCTPLHLAALMNRNVEILKYLVSQGADVNAKNNKNCTPLLAASKTDSNVEILQYLVSQGADINAKDIFGNMPIF